MGESKKLPLAFSFEDLVNFELEEPTPLVEGLLYLKNLSIVVAKPKAGKSTLCRFLSKTIVDNDDFLGRRTTGGTVLYLAIEEPLNNVKRDFLTMQVQNRKDLIISCLSGVSDKQKAILDLIKEFRPCLVVVDTLIHATAIRDLNDYVQTTTSLKEFRDVAEEFNTHICFVHHAKKGETLGNDSVLGSTGLTGAVDVIISIVHNPSGERLISSNGRSENNFEKTSLAFNANKKSFQLGLYTEDELSERVLNYIAENPGATRDDIRTALKKKNEHISLAINSLIPDRILVKRAGRKEHFYTQNTQQGEE